MRVRLLSIGIATVALAIGPTAAAYMSKGEWESQFGTCTGARPGTVCQRVPGGEVHPAATASGSSSTSPVTETGSSTTSGTGSAVTTVTTTPPPIPKPPPPEERPRLTPAERAATRRRVYDQLRTTPLEGEGETSQDESSALQRRQERLERGRPTFTSTPYIPPIERSPALAQRYMTDLAASGPGLALVLAGITSGIAACVWRTRRKW